jgi:predicted dehydrogenase
MKVLVVGAGSVGKRHAKNLISCGCEVSVVDPREDRRAECQEFSIAQFESLEEAGSIGLKQWDAAVVASPPHVHIEQARVLLEHDIPTLMEKPLTTAYAIGEPLGEVISKSKAPFMLGYTYRWWEPLIHFRHLVFDAPRIGRIMKIECCMAAHLADWHPWENYRDFFMSHVEQGGGALLDESHILDLMLWFLGMPEYVSSSISKISDLDITTDDNVEAFLFYKGGPLVTIHLDLYRRPHERSITAIGVDGMVKWNFDTVDVYWGEHHDHFTYDVERNDMFLKEIEDFIRVVKHGVDVECSYDDGMKVLEMIEALRQSSETKRLVKCR